MKFIFGLFGGIQAKLIAAAVFVTGLFALYTKIGRDAQAKQKAEHNEERLDAIQDKKKVEDDVKKSSDDDLIDGVLKRR